ncbi:Lectin-domain containing receptor kinase A4.3 [Hordeum vulgare]|nr:Lectin-domain containing receptor kinase A4.3 [Hordeum vulgare]
MDDPPPNSGDPTVVPATKAKKKKAPQGTKKPRSELTPEEIAKLDAESTKRRNRRAEAKSKDAAAAYAIELVALEAAREKADAQEKEDIVTKAHALLMMGLCCPTNFATAPVGPASTGSSVVRPPWCPSPTSSTMPLSPGFPPPRCQAHTRLSGSPGVSMIASSMPRPSSVIDLNVTPGSCSGGRPSVEMQRKQARLPSTTTMSSPHVLFGEMPTPTPTVEDPFYNQFMKNVIFEGRGEAFQTGGQGGTFDPEETQSQDGRGEYMADEDFETDHGDSWHEEDDIYCEGDEEEEDVVDIAGEPLFIDELTQRAEAQMRKKSIRTGSYTQDEDKLICESWKEIGQDPRVGVQQKGIVFWTRVHKTLHERKLFPSYQFTSDRNINSIQKRWLFIQQECNKYCVVLESVEARPVSGLGIGDMVWPLLFPLLLSCLDLLYD